ncbi:MAG: bifunctional shikimate kinase/3-dehydroquinate synthase [Actinomycetota bacterium]|nr:bifunctional shikimate kinase/3-dehydroquinate synthase [Actinomycetota bacterium]
MGAGKSTIGRKTARFADRPFMDTDEEIERRHGPIAQIFEEHGEAAFRRIEEAVAAEVLTADEPSVIALGGGAVTSDATRARLARRAFTVWVDIDVDEAWQRVGRSNRPLGRDEEAFRRLYEERREAYVLAADAVAEDAEDVLLGALAIVVEPGALAELGGFLGAEDGDVALVADPRVLELHRPELGERRASVHVVPRGERAKRTTVAARLWDELPLGRDGTVVALGGGCTTDLAGFVAATYLRGVRWVAVPTTLVGQVDAAIGGKTAIDLEKGKNAVGAFHYPDGVVIDPGVLRTLPARERRAGMAEVVKTGLLAGSEPWRDADEPMVRACAAFKAAVCLGDPFDEGRRAILNLGHTFAHALETASDYRLAHGEAVALGLLAALRLSGLPTDVVEELLAPQPARLDRDRAWAALQHDKKARAGRVRLVLLEAPGDPRFPVELPAGDVRRALGELIAD